MTYYIIILFLIMNFVGVFIMKVDKKRAVQHQFRISERTLWLVALFGGAIGTTIGMNLFHHKTKHQSFKIGFPLLAVIEAVIYIYFILV